MWAIHFLQEGRDIHFVRDYLGHTNLKTTQIYAEFAPPDWFARQKDAVDNLPDNNFRYHEAIDNVTPSDRFFGRDKEILEQRQRIKAETMTLRRKLYRIFKINDLMEDLS